LKRRGRVHVKQGAEGRELIVDGTFASFYRPGSPATGCVWDAIAAPLLCLPEARRRRVLVLGLGGGSAARIVRAIAPDCEIVGVEFDPAVVRAAREHLDLDALDVRVVLGDALAFLREDESRYDAILEDVFVGQGDAVHKPGWVPQPAHALAKKRLAPGGVFVSNTLDEAPVVAAALLALYDRVLSIEVEDYDNRIFAAGRDLCGAAELRAKIRSSPVLRETLPRLSLRTVSGASSSPRARPSRRP
jgi:spermidine synthase